MFVCVPVWKYRKTKKKNELLYFMACSLLYLLFASITMAFMYEEHRLNFDSSGPCSIFVWNDPKHGLRISNKCIHICTAPKFAFFVVVFLLFLFFKSFAPCENVAINQNISH